MTGGGLRPRRHVRADAGSDLGRLYDLAASDEPLWRDEDLATTLAAQLDLPARGGPSGAAGGGTLRSLLLDGATPESRLTGIKDDAKGWLDGAGPELAGIARAVYLAAIAAALVHHGETITRLPPGALRGQLAWLLAQQWVDADLRGVVRRALRALEGRWPGGVGGDGG